MKLTFKSSPVVCLFLSLALSTALGCRNESSGDPVTDTNTNWLAPCNEDSVCGGLECVCATCTQECQSDADCRALSANAVCSTPGADACAERRCLSVSSAPTGNEVPALSTPIADAAANDDDGTADDLVTSDPADESVEEPVDDSSTPDVPLDESLDDSDIDAQPPSVDEDASTAAASDGSTPDSGDATQGAGGATSQLDASVEAGGPPLVDDCEQATEAGACNVEGTTCGGPCTDACSFCNLLVCSAGQWQRLEAFPAPCFACGDGLQCNPFETYCHLEQGEASCRSLPTACVSEPSCDCLLGEVNSATCAVSGAGFELDVSTAPYEDVCSCRVFREDSGWCSPETGFVDEQYPIEWVCGGAETPRDELLADCVNLPTGAERWCCPSVFEPQCAAP